MQTPRRSHHVNRFLYGVLPVLAVVLLTSANSECAGLVGACTDIGCSDGLSVRVNDDLPGPATVHVAAGGEAHSFSCDPTYACIGFFEGWSPTQVQVTVEWEGGTFSAAGTPHYEQLYPNGRRCGPECRQGAVTVSVP